MPTGAPIPIFKRGAIVRVPFPYTDRPVRQRRPAVVVSSPAFHAQSHLLWVLMITSAENRPWPADILLVENHRSMGLPAPSLIRTAKIATIESSYAEVIGHLPDALGTLLDDRLRHHLGLIAPANN